MKSDQSNPIQFLTSAADNNKRFLKNGESAGEVLRRLKIQNKKLLQELLNLKDQLKKARTENKRMKKHLNDWLRLKKLILQSAWKY